MTTLPEHPTLAEARAWLRERFEEGADCPCCKQHVKLYKRHLNSSMAYVLLLLYRESVAAGFEKYLHVPSLIAHRTKDQPRLAAAVRGDWAKLRYWDLIEEHAGEREDDEGPHSGYWRLTHRGELFAQGAIRVPAYVHLYNGDLVRREVTETVDIHEALGTKFSYRDLMEAA
jgi:Zn ribbon nucleic-acid-binding protein